MMIEIQRPNYYTAKRAERNMVPVEKKDEDAFKKPQLISHPRLYEAQPVVPKNSTVNGDVNAGRDACIRIDGQVIGTVIVDTGGLIHVTVFGTVEGSVVEADYVFVDGVVRGDIKARKGVEVTATGNVRGRIAYGGLIAIQPGARIVGDIERIG